MDKRIGKGASILVRLTGLVWTSPKLSVKTNMAVYNVCVTSTLLYGREKWTAYAGQERRLNTFHMRSIRRILGISWQDKVTKMAVYNVCVTSTLLYGREKWTAYAGQERRLNTFHMRSIRRILGISWQDKVTNTDVLSRADLLRQRRPRWLVHVRRMEGGRIPKDTLYSVMALVTRTIGRPHLGYTDVSVRDMKAVDNDTMSRDRVVYSCSGQWLFLTN